MVTGKATLAHKSHGIQMGKRLKMILACIAAHAVVVMPATEILAQSAFVPLSNGVEDVFQHNMNRPGNGCHTSFRPLLRRDVVDAYRFAAGDTSDGDEPGPEYGRAYDSLLRIPVRTDRRFNNTLLGRKLFSEHLLSVEKEDVRLFLDPMVDFSAGKDRDDARDFFTNSRGVWVNGSIGRRFGFNATFSENLSRFPTYLDSSVTRLRVVPGQGRVKTTSDGNYDYAFVTGTINYQLNRHFTFEFGQDRHFIGDGYRSLLLSDNAFHYPYIKVISDFWKIRYVYMLTELRDLERQDYTDEAPFLRKYTTMHYLDINIGKHASVGIFEAVVWHGDSLTGARGIELGYLNPFIFLRPLEFSIGSPDNVLLGLNAKVMLSSHHTLYAQLMLDEFLLDNVRAGTGWWANKQGLQAGFKFFDLLGIRNLYLQGEVNYVRPFTYQHRDRLGGYSHYRAPLAHPLGANFTEFTGILNYRLNRWQLDAKASYAIAGFDTAGLNFGQNVLLTYLDRVSEYGNRTGQGLKTRILWADVTISWMINPLYRMQVFANSSLRRLQQPGKSENTLLIQAGLRTRLFNRYYDF